VRVQTFWQEGQAWLHGLRQIQDRASELISWMLTIAMTTAIDAIATRYPTSLSNDSGLDDGLRSRGDRA
jgi:hypothetical protein